MGFSFWYNKDMSIRTKIEHAYQRVFRGWDDSDSWNYDMTLVKTLPALKKCIAGRESIFELDEKVLDMHNKTLSCIKTIENYIAD